MPSSTSSDGRKNHSDGRKTGSDQGKNEPSTIVSIPNREEKSSSIRNKKATALVETAGAPTPGSVSDPSPSGRPKKSTKSATTSTASPAPPVDSFESRLQELNKNWTERFNRFEAMMLAKSFQPVVVPVSPARETVPASARPFIPPTQASTVADVQPAGGQPTQDQVEVDQPVVVEAVSAPSTAVPHRQGPPREAAGPSSRPTDDGQSSEMEVGELDSDPDLEILEVQEEGPSEDHSYRETVRGVRGFMGWTHIPDIDAPSQQEDNPFAGVRTVPSGKVSVVLPVDDWLCRKMEGLNMTVARGYPTRSSDSSGLAKSEFVKSPAPTKWYGLHPADSSSANPNKVVSWPRQVATLNSGFPRLVSAFKPAKLPRTRPISQETVKKWEAAARSSSYVCNQAAGFSRCLTKIQESMQHHLRLCQQEESGKGKSLPKHNPAMDELAYLVNFNQTVTRALSRTLQDLSENCFCQLTNLILLRRDSYLDTVKFGIKPDTLSSLRCAPLHLSTLFPDALISKAETEIATQEGKGGFPRKDRPGHPYRQARPRDGYQPAGGRQPPHPQQHLPAWKTQPSHTHRHTQKKFVQRPAKGTKPYK